MNDDTVVTGADTDTVSIGVGANTVVNDAQPTGSEDIEQPSQVGNDTVGTNADTDTGTDTGLGLESLLGPQNETSQVNDDTVVTGADTDTGTYRPRLRVIIRSPK